MQTKRRTVSRRGAAKILYIHLQLYYFLRPTANSKSNMVKLRLWSHEECRPVADITISAYTIIYIYYLIIYCIIIDKVASVDLLAVVRQQDIHSSACVQRRRTCHQELAQTTDHS